RVRLAEPEWLHQLACAGLLAGPLPEAHQPPQLLLGPQQPPARVALPPPAAAGVSGAGDREPLLLAGFVFGFSSRWKRDPGLAVLVSELGGRVLAEEEEVRRGEAAGVVVVTEEEEEGMEQGSGSRRALHAQQLLMSILTAANAAAVRGLLESVRSRVAGAAGSAQPADSDMTQAAD
ncbi:hypothetical protein Agub_g1334, partial [Astrephomene gubernaculifera]